MLKTFKVYRAYDFIWPGEPKILEGIDSPLIYTANTEDEAVEQFCKDYNLNLVDTHEDFRCTLICAEDENGDYTSEYCGDCGDYHGYWAIDEVR